MRRKGFTLIEVLVVVLIIAVLAVMAVPSFRNAGITNKMEKARIGLIEFTSAVRLYNDANKNDSTDVSLNGVFNEDMFNLLTATSDGEKPYLEQSTRWLSVSGNMSLKEGSATTALNCTYKTANTGNILSCVYCDFGTADTKKVKYYVNRTDPSRIVMVKGPGGC